MTIRVLLADDHAMIRGALRALLSLEDDIDVVADVGRGDDVIATVIDTQPDVAVLDIEMPGMTGVEVTSALTRAGSVCKVLILTTFARTGYLKDALAAGARGFMAKDTHPDELARAIRAIAGGGMALDPQLAADAVTGGGNPLTEREQQVLSEALGGATVKSIGVTLSLSPGTVRNYLSSAISKTHASTRVEAAHIAHSRGWI